MLDRPVVGQASRLLSGTPALSEISAAGVPATLSVPAGRGPWPAAVFVNGVTARGRAHPQVRRLAEGLARAGVLTLVPDPEGLPTGELTPRTIEQTVAAALAVADRPDVKSGQVALYSASAGSAIALIAAQEGALRDRLSVVAGTVPYAHLREATRVATTGTYALGGRVRAWSAPAFLGLVIARSVVAALRPSQTRDRLREELLALPDDVEDPFAPFRARLSAPHARAVADMFTNDDPDRFDGLYEALPEYIRSGLNALSPLPGADAVRAPVELVTAPRDSYFPIEDGRALTAATDGTLTVTRALQHAVPTANREGVADTGRLFGWAARVLAAAG